MNSLNVLYFVLRIIWQGHEFDDICISRCKQLFAELVTMYC